MAPGDERRNRAITMSAIAPCTMNGRGGSTICLGRWSSGAAVPHHVVEQSMERRRMCHPLRGERSTADRCHRIEDIDKSPLTTYGSQVCVFTHCLMEKPCHKGWRYAPVRIQGDAAMFFISHLLSETSIEANRGGGVVVPADNGVNEQTANSIACACQAGVPLLIAVNKMDLPSADPG